MELGEVAYGGRTSFDGMPTHKCKNCQTTFAVRLRTRKALSLGKLISGFVMFIFVGYISGNATIVTDSVVTSIFPQILSGSMQFPAPLQDIAFWCLGVFAVIVLLIIGITTKSKTIVCSGVGYFAGFLFSAWFLSAWWTIVLEVGTLILFLTVYAMLSE